MLATPTLTVTTGGRTPEPKLSRSTRRLMRSPTTRAPAPAPSPCVPPAGSEVDLLPRLGYEEPGQIAQQRVTGTRPKWSLKWRLQQALDGQRAIVEIGKRGGASEQDEGHAGDQQVELGAHRSRPGATGAQEHDSRERESAEDLEPLKELKAAGDHEKRAEGGGQVGSLPQLALDERPEAGGLLAHDPDADAGDLGMARAQLRELGGDGRLVLEEDRVRDALV